MHKKQLVFEHDKDDSSLLDEKQLKIVCHGTYYKPVQQIKTEGLSLVFFLYLSFIICFVTNVQYYQLKLEKWQEIIFIFQMDYQMIQMKNEYD